MNAHEQTPLYRPSGVLALRGAHLRVVRFLSAAARDMRRRWYLYGPVWAIWALAGWRVLVDPAPHVPLLVNWTPSLPYTFAVVERLGGPTGAVASLKRGDYVVFAFDGEGRKFYPGLHRQALFKRIAGTPGDQVTVVNRRVYVNGVNVGLAKPYAFDHRLLEPIEPGVIPAGRYYVQGTGVDSFDSRYRISGLVAGTQVLAKVRPIF